MVASEDDEKQFARKALHMAFFGNYILTLKEALGFDFSDKKEAAFLLMCGEYFFDENRILRPAALFSQASQLASSLRDGYGENGRYKADLTEKFLIEIIDEFTNDKAQYYACFLNEFAATDQVFGFLRTERAKKIRQSINDRFDEDFEHPVEFMNENNITNPIIFAYEKACPPHLKMLCEFFTAEGLHQKLYEETNLTYLVFVDMIKNMLVQK